MYNFVSHVKIIVNCNHKSIRCVVLRLTKFVWVVTLNNNDHNNIKVATLRNI